jgi:hypothetical protein
VTRAAAPARRAVRAVDDDSATWGVPRSLAWALLGVPLALMAAMMAIAVVDADLFHALIVEDGPIEWAQFFAILIASGVFALAAIGTRTSGRHGLTAIYVVVAIGAFLAAGEEISWGQRLLGFTTPEALDTINHAGETNIHNISAIQRLFNLGELLAGLYGLAVPLLWLVPRIRARVGRWMDPLLIPPVCLAAAFLLPFLYRLGRLIVLPTAGERIVELGEVPELTFYLGVLVTGLTTTRILRSRAAGRAVGPIGPATPPIAPPG